MLLLPTILNHDIIFVRDRVTIVRTARQKKARVTDAMKSVITLKSAVHDQNIRLLQHVHQLKLLDLLLL